MKAFVTGGSGFVGRALIEGLRARGDEVAALARSERAAAVVRDAGATAVRGDLDDVADMRDGMAGCEVAFHCAAIVTDWGDPADFERVNVRGTQHVIDAAREAGVRRVVHIGTEAVLLGVPIVRADETVPKPAKTVGIYGRTKAAAEDLVLAANGDDFETVVVRPRFIWGAGDTSLMPQLVQAWNDGSLKLIGGGKHLTSTCHVRNVVEGTLLAADKGRPGEIYFLTDGEPVELRRFLTDLMATEGIDISRVGSVPRWLAAGLAPVVEGIWRLFRRRGRPPITRAIVKLIGSEVTVVDAKARRELGYQSSITIEQGLAEMTPAAGAASAASASDVNR